MKSSLVIVILILCLSVLTFDVRSQCACCSAAAAGSSYSIFNSNGANASRKQLIFDISAEHRSFRDQPDHGEGLDEETPLKSMVITSVGIRYGLSDRLTLSAQLPIVFLHTELGGEQGIGDIAVIAHYSLLSKNGYALAISGGVELPTGQQRQSSFDNTTVVVGSGSFDPMVGFTASKRGVRSSVQLTNFLRKTTRGFDGVTYGDLNFHSLTYAYLLNSNFDETTNGSKKITYGIAGGYYGEWLGKIEEKNEVDENSGYYLGFATLSMNIRTARWEFPVTFSQPVVQVLNGEQGKVNPRIRVGITRRF